MKLSSRFKNFAKMGVFCGAIAGAGQGCVDHFVEEEKLLVGPKCAGDEIDYAGQADFFGNPVGDQCSGFARRVEEVLCFFDRDWGVDPDNFEKIVYHEETEQGNDVDIWLEGITDQGLDTSFAYCYYYDLSAGAESENLVECYFEDLEENHFYISSYTGDGYSDLCLDFHHNGSEDHAYGCLWSDMAGGVTESGVPYDKDSLLACSFWVMSA